jgi:hypothetical protein
MTPGLSPFQLPQLLFFRKTPRVLHCIRGFAVGMILLVTSLRLGAELLASEDFIYDSTLIIGAHGGKGWAEPWTGINFVTASSLSFPGLATVGHKLTTGNPPGNDSVKCSFRSLSRDGPDVLMEDGKFGRDYTTLWISFLVNTPAGRSTGYGGLSLFDDNRQQLFLGDTGASNVWAFERTGQLQRFSEVEANDAVCFLVYRISFLPGDERIDMWVNPKPGRREPAETTAAASETSVRDFRFNRVRVCAAPVPMSFDALRIGTTYADVATAARNWGMLWVIVIQVLIFAAAAILALFIWRMRRRKSGSSA